MTLKVIPKFVDLSHYDDVQDAFAGAVKFGIKGVINKLTENTSVLDKSAEWRIGPAVKVGLHFGVYHFIRPGRIAEQAAWFLKNLADLQATAPGVFIRIVLDFETDGVSPADAKQWLTIVHGATGQWPWLYSYSAFMGEHFTKPDIADQFWKQIELWIAAYNDHPTWPACWEDPIAWQFTGDGSGQEPHAVPGIVIAGSKGIDINSFSGTDDELTTKWNAMPAAPAAA